MEPAADDDEEVCPCEGCPDCNHAFRPLECSCYNRGYEAGYEAALDKVDRAFKEIVLRHITGGS